MGADSFESVVAVSQWVGHSLTDLQNTRLQRYCDWLRDEATPAGGIGPHELDRLWRRHIADSLLFQFGLSDATTCIDIGSGVGLPGIPLAIWNPHVTFDLVDRSGKRCDLIRRAVAVLGLGNCTVVQQDISRVTQRYGAVVSRAAIPAEAMMIHVKHLLEPGGIAVLGLTWGETLPAIPLGDADHSVLVVDVPTDILDTDVKLLRIEAT